MRLKAVVFDLDDTLYPERDYVLSGFRRVARWMEYRGGGPAERSFDELRHLVDSGVRGETFDVWLQRRGLEAALSADLVDVYRSHHPKIAPFPGVRALLRRLSRRALLGLLSDGYLEVQRAKLDALRLRRYFDAVVFSDALGREAWKPSPAPFQAMVARLRVDPATAVYVADNPAKDFLGARRAGMTSIRVRRADGIYGALEPTTSEHAPDHEIGALGELLTLVATLEAGEVSTSTG